MNLMNAQASAVCLAVREIITGCPPLQPGAWPPGPAGVCRITHWPANLLWLGSFAVASWKVQLRLAAFWPSLNDFRTSSSSDDVEAGLASPSSSSIFMNSSALTPPPVLKTAFPDESRDLPL